MDRKEVWEHAVSALEREFTSGEFGEGEFRVVQNEAMRTVSIISGGRVFTLMDVSFSHLTGGRHDDDPVSVHLHSKPSWLYG